MLATRRRPVAPLATVKSAKIPTWVSDLESFRRWSDSRRFPEVGRISFYDGAVHVDMSKEQLYTHGQVKTEASYTITSMVKSAKLGRIWIDSAYSPPERPYLS